MRANTFGIIATLAVAFVPAGRRTAAAQYTWIGGSGPAWNNAANWTPTGFPNSPTATATFSGQSLGNVIIGLSQSAQSVTFSNPTGNYTLTSLGGQTLSGVTAITVDAGVTGVETINLANVSTGSLLFPNGSFLTIANNSTAAGTTLVFGPSTVIGTTFGGYVTFSGGGTTQISGSFANSVSGGVYMNGPGTLILSNGNNVYGGGTFVFGGTLAVGANGAVIPAGSTVHVQAGATYDLRTFTNGSANALGYVDLNGGTLQASGATNSDFYTQQLTMTGGTVDFTNTPFTWIHVTGSSGITTNASSTTAIWNGANSGLSRIQNDTANQMNITVAAGTTPSGIDLDAGIALSIAGANSTFVKAGQGTMRLTSLNNSANFTASQGNLRVDDMAALGSGAVTLGGGTLQYGGATATSTKALGLANVGRIEVTTGGTKLTLNGVLSEVTPGSALFVRGNNGNGSPPTLTLNADSTYTGGIWVDGNLILAVPTLVDAAEPSPVGSSSNLASHVILGSNQFRGTLLLTGTNPSYITDRGVSLGGDAASYSNNGAGGAIGVQNETTNLEVFGQLTSGALIKTGPGTLTLYSTTSNYTGGTYVEAGTLNVGAGGAVIPANGSVTVFTGAKFQLGFMNSDNIAAPIGTITLNGGALTAAAGTNLVYSLNQLVTSAAGGTVDFTGSYVQLLLEGANTAVTVNGSSTWSGGATAQIQNFSAAPTTITVAPAVTLTNHIPLSGGFGFRLVGGGTLYMATPIYRSTSGFMVSQGRLRVDDLSVAADGSSVLGDVPTSFLELDGGTLQYSGPTATSPRPLTLTSAGGTMEISDPAATLTYTGSIASIGPLTKSGPGALVLNNLANQYAPGITVSGGRLEVSDDAQLGLAAITVNPFGTLRYTANATTARTFTLNAGALEVASGVTLTLNGAGVGGGFLRGTGSFILNGGAVLNGASTLSSTTVVQTGPALVTNFSNGGTFTVSAGQTLAWNGGVNTSSGNFTISGTANVNDLVSDGQLTVAGSGLINNSGSNLVLGGGSRTTINSGGAINLSGGTTIELNGGLLVNNGAITGTTNVNFGSLAKGTGLYGMVNVGQGGIYSPGNSPGIVTAAAVKFDNTPVGSGAPVLQIELAGIAPGTEYDQLHVTGQLSLGGALKVSLLNAFAPAAGNTFDILDWGTLSGTFASLQLPALSGGLQWNTNQLYTAGILSVSGANSPHGDFNRDGHVNAADIPAMLAALTDLNAYKSANVLSDAEVLAIGDVDGNSKVNNADAQALLTLLKSGGGSVDSVPEPASILALGAGSACLLLAFHRCRAKATDR